MVGYSSDTSPRRQGRSPSQNISPPRGPPGLPSLSGAVGLYANTSMVAPNALSPDLGFTGRPDYFGGSNGAYSSRHSPAISPYATHYANQMRPGPSIHPGAGNSFASASSASAITTTILTNGRGASASSVAQRNGSFVSGQPGVTHHPQYHHQHTNSFSTDHYGSPASGSPEHERRTRRRRGPSQREMLSKALQMANDAVVLDNDADLEGAVAAYREACHLLSKVMNRSSVIEDRQKLDAIRSTYKDRILELRGSMAYSDEDLNDLLEAQGSGYLQDDEVDRFADRDTEYEHAGTIEDENSTYDYYSAQVQRRPSSPPIYPRRNQSLPNHNLQDTNGHDPMPRNAWLPNRMPPPDLALPSIPAAQEHIMPAPLSPRRMRSPARPDPSESLQHPQPQQPGLSVHSGRHPGAERGHSRQDTAESSWLDTIDESGDSTSSAPSRASSVHDDMGRRYMVRRSGATTTDFDMALDSAIEAAYEEGLDPHQVEDDLNNGGLLMIERDGRVREINDQMSPPPGDDQFPSDIRRKLQAAKERVRQAEREDTIVKTQIELRSGRATPAGRQTPAGRRTPAPGVNELYEKDEVEEEERILEEMQEYAAITPSLPSGHFPHDSDASSRHAWTSSAGSTDASAATSMAASEIPKSVPLTALGGDAGPSRRPPSLTLPEIPGSKKASPVIPPPLLSASSLASFAPAIVSPGVYDRRRLSGRRVGALTIDTGTKMDPSLAGPKTVGANRLSPVKQFEFDDIPKSAVEPERSFSSQLETSRSIVTAPHSFELGLETGSASPHTSLFARTPLSETKSVQQPSVPPSPARSRPGTASGLRKNFSSSSLKSLKNIVATPTTAEDSPHTPMTGLFSVSSQPGHGNVPSVPELPTPAAASFLRHGIGGPNGMSFFNVDIHSLASPGSPNPAIPNGPAPLEPCPESFLLRPFWVLRCIYQVIANPHGGYLSQKLFVPRDIWRVRNVKLKNVDEKVAQCDLLTAALLKLAKSDTDDADAVLEEMQAFELILDQVQATMQKRLGAEVGLQGAQALFKNNAGADDAVSTTTTVSSTASRISSGWRKFRTRGPSAPGLPSVSSSATLSRDVRDTLSMKSLPMATGFTVPKKHVKRDPTKILGIGPHANYMAALARLSDAAQILDQVARQVEDPGLRHSSKTHVGLELCTRHAAEFFAFFICRFALSDISAMLDKFIKRGSDWVLA